MTKEELLKMFPEYRPTVYHVDMNNNIDPVFTYWDRMELIGMAVEKHNEENLQGVLFL